MYNLEKLGLVEADENSDDYTIRVVKSEQVKAFFSQILWGKKITSKSYSLVIFISLILSNYQFSSFSTHSGCIFP